jgi:hypothetical protein
VADFAWQHKVEVAFASQPMAPSPTWTDISTYASAVNPLGVQRGRPDEFSDVQPGTMGLLLNNADGRFTRDRPASPYYPNVRNGRRIRVSIIYNSTTYVRFDGHVNEWPTTWEEGTGAAQSWVQVTATDRSKRLGQPGELRSMVEEEVLRDAVAADSTHGSAYYPLSEAAEATSAGSITVQPQGSAIIRQVGSGGTLEFGSGTGPGTDQLSAPLFTPASPTGGKLLDATLRTGVGGASGVTLEGFFRAEGTVSSIAIVGMLQAPAGATAELRISAGGKLSGAAWTAVDGGYYFNLESLARVDDGRTHHGALTLSISGSTVTARLYLDGAQVDSTTFTVTALSTYQRLTIGGDPKAGRLFNGTLSHVAAHSAALTATRVAAHAQAGLTGLAGERTDQRIGRIADWIALPSADRAFDVGNGTMGAQSTSGQQPIEALRQAASVESGVLFFSRSGTLTFHNRSRRYNLAPTIILDVAQGHIAPDLAFPGDDFGVVNDMTVSRPDGASARFTDQASIDEYGLYRDSAEIPTGSADELSSAASWRVNTYGQPHIRVPTVTVNLHDPRVASLIPSLLGADISTKVRLANLPSQAPASTVDVFVEGYSEQFTGDTWTLSFNCSPGDVYDVWALGVAGRSELGVTTRLAQAGATAPLGDWSDVFSDTF